MAELHSAQNDALARHGDTLYRVALLLAPDAGRAADALRAAFRSPRALGAGAELDEQLPLVLAALARRPEKARRLARGAKLDITSALASLPFAQRRVLALRLLLGRSLPEAARLSGIEAEAARDDFAAAIGALAAATGQPLPDALPTERCAAARALIAREPGDAAAEALVRGHAALCDACRSFERAWAALVRQAEAALRARVRDERMPAELAAALRRPPGGARQQVAVLVARVGARRLALALVPAGVLLLIAALVLPGFWRAPAQPLDGAGVATDAQTLVRRALAQIGQPPAGEGALWHGRWQSQWHFPAGTSAPVTLDAWLDPRGARHRLQVVHAEGGAPFELQVGSGDDLFYALASSYYESLYGAQPPGYQPQLVRWRLDAAQLRRAARERQEAGAWGLPTSYLRAARAAPDLRTLGRQRDGERAVWLVAYGGYSPLGLPVDAPQVTGDGRVRVLLALDAEDGRLRSVSELSDAGGGAQASQVTWRLLSEEWLPNESAARAALDPERAWNGRGSFPDTPQGAPPDPTLLLADAGHLSGLEPLLVRTTPQLVLPDPPPGAERALVLWNEDGSGDPASYGSLDAARLVYFGEGRQLTLSWNPGLLGNGEREMRFPAGWKVLLEARRGLLYRLEAESRNPLPSDQGGAARVAIEARGYSAAELLALVESLGQLDLGRWRAQRALFAGASRVESAPRAALEAVADAAQPPSPDGAQYQRVRAFVRRGQLPDALPDPFHMTPDADMPNVVVQESWLRVAETGRVDALWRTRPAVGGAIAWSSANIGDKGWFYNAPRGSLSFYDNGFVGFGLPAWLPLGARAALDMLANPGYGVRIDDSAGAERGIVRDRPILPGELLPEGFYIPGGAGIANPRIADLSPTRMITSLILDYENRVVHFRAEVASDPSVRSANTLVHQWDLEAHEVVELSDAPAELRDGAAPSVPARYVYSSDTNGSRAFARTVPLSQAVELAATPLLAPPAAGAARLDKAELGQREPNNGRSDSSQDPFYDAVRNGCAVRLTYRVPGSAQASLFEGPAEEFADYIRTHYASPVWERSEPRRLTLAGREVEGWLLWNVDSARDSYLAAAFDGTLVVLAGLEGWLLREGEGFLAGLEPVQ